MELSIWILGIVGIGALLLVVFNKEDSILIPAGLIVSISLGFFIAKAAMLPSIMILASIPSGLLLAWFARDELVAGRKWFSLLGLISGAGILISIFMKNNLMVYTFASMLITAGISFSKSYDKKWTKKRIKY